MILDIITLVLAQIFAAIFKQTEKYEELVNPSRPNPGREEKINLNCYFPTSLWCLKRFHEGPEALHKTF